MVSPGDTIFFFKRLHPFFHRVLLDDFSVNFDGLKSNFEQVAFELFLFK